MNGTVNAPSNRIGMDHRQARNASINGNGTINLTSKGRLIGIGGDDWTGATLTLDGVTLVGLPDIVDNEYN